MVGRFDQFMDIELQTLSSVFPYYARNDTLWLEIESEIQKRHKIQTKQLEEEKRKNAIICECCDQVTGYKVQT